MFGAELGRIGARSSLRRSRNRGLPQGEGGSSKTRIDGRLDRKVPQGQSEDENDGDRWDGTPLGPVLMCGANWRTVVFAGSENTR